ncbi:hypothetical protein GCM10011450_10670 [Advenella faeciporci]|uniref:Uncharacterized protein n=1 Tax=Advenella faeciporci TaxID=797535 RepID=A0A918JI21_9BURK|nr:hypothetical protein GCM10011450_10670 [Advenella faeciporci]
MPLFALLYKQQNFKHNVLSFRKIPIFQTQYNKDAINHKESKAWITWVRELEKQRFNFLVNKKHDQFARLCNKDLRYVHTSGTVDDVSGNAI